MWRESSESQNKKQVKQLTSFCFINGELCDGNNIYILLKKAKIFYKWAWPAKGFNVAIIQTAKYKYIKQTSWEEVILVAFWILWKWLKSNNIHAHFPYNGYVKNH